MILSRFLKPKWQHNDPTTRQQALQELDKADPKLLELARNDPDPTVRQAALERLVDVAALQTIADTDTNSNVQRAAYNRQRLLIAGKVVDGPVLMDRLDWLRHHNSDTGLIEFLLQEAVESELRLMALSSIDVEQHLATIVLQNPHQDLRWAALARITTPELLEQISRNTRNRDKRLYRQARERLDAYTTAQAQTAHLERLCVEMEQLLWDGETGPNAGRFPKLEHEWRDQETHANAELRERYTQARARFLAERQASATRRAQRLELLASLEQLLEQLRQHTQLSAELLVAIQKATHEKPALWSQLGPIQDADGRRLDLRFQQLQHDIAEQERVLQRNHSRADRLHEVLHHAEALLEQPSEVREVDLKHLRQRWEGLERPESRELTAELQSRLDGLFDKLRARLQRQIQQRDQEWQQLQDVVQQLEVALEAGELQQATHLQEQARQRLKHNIGLSRAQMVAIEERLQHCASQIGALRGWRRWGAHQAREQLCASIESLIGQEADPVDTAQRIQKLREAWKALDHHEGAAPKALWKRFNDACERAYAPCQAYFEAQSRERQENLEHKQALCEQLEQFEAATDWQQPHWREVDRLHRRAREQWYKLGPVNRTERKALDRRYQQIMQRFETQLSAERDREYQRRQQLIQHLQALVESPDLRTAIDAAKHAQAQWHPTVQALPRQEQALWKEFRAACDAIFARRQQEQQAADTERQSNLARRLELCTEIEALGQIEHGQLVEAYTRLAAIQQEWATLGPIPKAEQRSSEQRYEAALRQFSHHEQFLSQTGSRENFKQMHARSRLCARLERLLALAPVDVEMLKQSRETWETLAPLPEALLVPIQQRFHTVIAALTDQPEQAPALMASLEKNLERKQVWCICMEIIAGVDSPANCAQQRMEYQVARLSASLAGATAKPHTLYDPHMLQEQWCMVGALPADVETELDTRFIQALSAWWQRHSTSESRPDSASV